MNQSEYNKIKEILSSEPFQVRPRMIEYMRSVTPKEEEKEYPKRTGAQRNAYFLWLEQIAQQCVNMGVTADLLFKHTAHITVTKELLHSAVKTLIKVLWNLDSTNDLRKTGHLDDIQDHMASWLGKENVQIPPFPSDELKAEEAISIPKRTTTVEYDDYTGPPTI